MAAHLMIVSPDVPTDHPERDDDCETALGPAFLAFCAAAEAAGWGPDEVDGAVVALMVVRLAERGETVQTRPEVSEALRERRN